MYNSTNPAELYSGTTWELITSGKYIQTGNTPLSTGGSNTISIAKTNLPNVKLKVDSFSLTTKPHTHDLGPLNDQKSSGTYMTMQYQSWRTPNKGNYWITQEGGGQNTGTASPSTETLGNGTAINVQPTYITLRFWKRLT